MESRSDGEVLPLDGRSSLDVESSGVAPYAPLRWAQGVAFLECNPIEKECFL